MDRGKHAIECDTVSFCELRWWKWSVRSDKASTKIKFVAMSAQRAREKLEIFLTAYHRWLRVPIKSSIFFAEQHRETATPLSNTIINDIETILIYLENKCQMPPTVWVCLYDAFCWVRCARTHHVSFENLSWWRRRRRNSLTFSFWLRKVEESSKTGQEHEMQTTDRLRKSK